MKRVRLLIGLGIVCLAAAYVLPLWRIELEAPQYPEPIGFFITINSLRGIGEHDLENINILNHYIGMKPIVPESIPELRIMPWVLAGLIAVGFGALALPRRWTLGVWVGAIVVTGAVGLYDFDRWERDYGSNLNPTAPIKIEGMTYKPPLIGSKQLLNITAHSYPWWGGYAVVAAAVLGAVALWKLRPSQQPAVTVSTRVAEVGSAAARSALIVGTLISGISCAPKAEPIRYGVDECVLCRMTISDQRFGAEIVTTTGKAYKFDSIECMVNYLRSKALEQSAIALVLTTDFLKPGSLIDATTASYLRSEKIPSPMGADLSSYADRSAAERMRAQYGGEILSWQQVQQYVATLD